MPECPTVLTQIEATQQVAKATVPGFYVVVLNSSIDETLHLERNADNRADN